MTNLHAVKEETLFGAKTEVEIHIKAELSLEEILVLKEIAQDRMAVSRVWGRTKNIALAITAIIIAYLTVVENGIKWLKTQIGI